MNALPDFLWSQATHPSWMTVLAVTLAYLAVTNIYLAFNGTDGDTTTNTIAFLGLAAIAGWATQELHPAFGWTTLTTTILTALYLVKVVPRAHLVDWRHRQRRLASHQANMSDILRLTTTRNGNATPSTEPIMTAIYNNQITSAIAGRWIHAGHSRQSLALAARAGLTDPELRDHLDGTHTIDWAPVELLASLRNTG